MVEIAQGLVAASQLVQRQPAMGADVGMAGRLSKQRFKHRQRFGGAALLQPHHADHVARRKIGAMQFQDAAIKLLRLIQLPGSLQLGGLGAQLLDLKGVAHRFSPSTAGDSPHGA